MKLHKMRQDLHQQCQMIRGMQGEARDRIWVGLTPFHLYLKTVSNGNMQGDLREGEEATGIYHHEITCKRGDIGFH